MTCLELTRMLAEHFARALPPDVSAALEAHAEDCSCCRSLVRTYGVTIELSASLAAVPVPETVSAKVRAAVRALAREGA